MWRWRIRAELLGIGPTGHGDLARSRFSLAQRPDRELSVLGNEPPASSLEDLEALVEEEATSIHISELMASMFAPSPEQPGENAKV